MALGKAIADMSEHYQSIVHAGTLTITAPDYESSLCLGEILGTKLSMQELAY
jgi:hypothetical protein